jgi:DNA-directed RNA polymerase specialized sigma24 family protein
MEHERFGALVAPHTNAMARVAAALVGLADAEDAAQEALLRAWRAWPTLREVGAVHSWLLRITTNVCRNWQTGRFGAQQRVTQSLDSDSTQTLLQHAGVSGPGTASHTDALDLQRAIAELNDDLRSPRGASCHNQDAPATRVDPAARLVGVHVRRRIIRVDNLSTLYAAHLLALSRPGGNA